MTKTKLAMLVFIAMIGISFIFLAPMISKGYKVYQIERYQTKRAKCEANMKLYNERATELRESLFKQA
jgi:hypothetical protein